MKQSGRASLLSILAIASILLVLGLLLFTRESVTSVTARFLTALQKGDVQTLTNMSYLGSDSKEEVAEQWDFAVNKAGRYYVFLFRVVSSSQPSPNTASVKVGVIRNPGQINSYEENYSIPLVKVGNEWKIDVRGMSRDLYPALPR